MRPTDIDSLLHAATQSDDPLPGVVAIAGDRTHTLYEGAAGLRRLGEDAAMTSDSVLALFSCSKAITATAALQLVEEGRLDLDAPARLHAPEIAEVQVLEGFADDGAPILRAPRREITTRMLMLHTAGFGYDFFNPTLARLTRERGQANPRMGTKAGLQAPLLFDPGEQWEYGLGIDWCGQVIEGVCGASLDKVLAERIFAPLGMTSTGFVMTPQMRARRASMHARGRDGRLIPIDFELPATPEVFMGGGALFGTAPDYMRFLRMWLNDGAGEHGRELKPETVAMASLPGLGDLRVKPLPGVNRALTHDAEFFPGMPKSWALSFLVNLEDAPTGRPAGSLAWAGLANLYYWIDRKNGVAGFWAAQAFPFCHPTATKSFTAFETGVYDSFVASKRASSAKE